VRGVEIGPYYYRSVEMAWGCKHIPTPFTLLKLHTWKLLEINTNFSSLSVHLHTFVYSDLGDDLCDILYPFFKRLCTNSSTLLRYLLGCSSTVDPQKSTVPYHS
jgi:hypothetical protein